MSRLLNPKGGDDCVQTPELLAKSIIEYFAPKGLILEPCRGESSFYNNLPEPKDWCEIKEGKDFFCDYHEKVNWIITNPPFSLMRKFLQHSMQLSDNIIFLCPINHIIGLKARLRDIRENGFYIREILQIDTPKEFPSSGFQWAANYLNKEKGDCKISYLQY